MAASYQWVNNQVILKVFNGNNDGNVWVVSHGFPGKWFKLRSGAAKTMIVIAMASRTAHKAPYVVSFEWKDYTGGDGYIRKMTI